MSTIDETLAKGYRKGLFRTQNGRMEKHLDALENEINKRNKKSRNRFIKEAVKDLYNFWGDAIFYEEIYGEGKTYEGLFCSIYIGDPTTDEIDESSSIFISYVYGRKCRYELLCLPITISKHGLSRLIQSANSNHESDLGRYLKDHLDALSELNFGMGHCDENLLVYCKNGLSIWVVIKPLEYEDFAGTDYGHSHVILKSFINTNVLEPKHLKYAELRGKNTYYHRYVKAQETILEK
jgi:hypothetical protein